MEFTPAASGRKKPITKAQLRKLQSQYASAEQIAHQARELENEQKQKEAQKLENALDNAFDL